jgi:catechol 2,3-dioxygenase-like lactoylglutathione lyase family enzyme
MTTLPLAPSIRLHISLNVTDLGRSIAFYQTLFGLAPAKRRDDYAKFELDDPPLVLSLEPARPFTTGALNHLGFRLPDSPTLVVMQRRLEEAGFRSQREEGVECCYAKQTKFWITDPDQTLWEFYTLEGDIEHRGVGQSREQMQSGAATTHVCAPATWQHRLGEPIPALIPHPEGSLDEVVLRGTLNVPLADDVQQRLARESLRVLRPGGRIFVHVLVAERKLSAPPRLPGPAAAVQYTPLEEEPVRLLEKSGFSDLNFLKFGTSPCFMAEGVGLREMQLEAFKRVRT